MLLTCNYKKTTTLIAFAFIVGCASVNKVSEKQGLSIKDEFRKGDMKGALSHLEKTYSAVNRDNTNRVDTTYFLDKGTVLRFVSTESVKESSLVYKKAEDIEKELENIPKAKPVERLPEVKKGKTSDDLTASFKKIGDDFTKIGSDLKKAGNAIAGDDDGSYAQSQLYRTKDHEQSYLNLSQLINYAAIGNQDGLFAETKRVSLIEDKIKKDNEKMVAGVKERLKGQGVFDSPAKITGYPKAIIDSPQVASLENGYSNAAAWYTAAYLFEKLGNTGMSETSYRRALQIRGDIPIFRDSAGDIVDVVKGKQKKSRVSSPSKQVSKAPRPNDKDSVDLLVIVEGGQLSDLYTYRQEMPIMTPNGPGKVTYAVPALKDNAQLISLKSVTLGSTSIPLYEAANMEYMSRRDLKDWLPEYISAASAEVSAQIALESLANKEIDKGVGGIGGALLKGVAADVIGTVGDQDTRSWKTMPAQIFIGRATVPKGTFPVQLPGFTSQKQQSLTLDAGYKILHLRVINNQIFSTNQL